jgi:hypothetical protein
MPGPSERCQIEALEGRRIDRFVEFRQRRAGSAQPASGADDFCHGLLLPTG